jgi:hypothetical protein
LDKIQIIESFFYYIVTFSYLIIPLFFLFSKKNKKDVLPLTLAIYGVVICALLIIFKEILPKDVRKIYQAFYTTLEYSFFAFIFWINIRNKKIKWAIAFASALFIIFQVSYFFATLNTKQKLDSIPIGIETILLLIYIFLFFYEFSKTAGTTFIYNNYCFWISVGILIYLGGSFFFYILIDHLNNEDVDTFGNLTFVAEIIKNILFGIAIFIYSRYPHENPKQKPAVPYLDMI